MYIFISEWMRSAVHTWICLNKKDRALLGFDGLYYRAEEERDWSANKKQGEKSCVVSHNFIFINKFICFENSAGYFVILMRSE